MSYRPLMEEEKAEILKKIKKVKESIKLDHEYLANLGEELEMGVWVSDWNFSTPIKWRWDTKKG